MKKRIVICCNVYPPNFLGGAELIAHYQAKALKQLGHEVVIFTGDTQHCGKRYSLRREAYGDLTVYRVSLWPTDYQSEFVNFSHREVEQHFDALLEDFSPDVVHLHNLIGLSVGIIHLAKRRKIKTVLTVHDHWGFCYKNTLLKYGAEVCSNYTRCAKCMPFVQDGDGKQIPIRLRRDFLAMQLSEVDVFISPSRYLAEAYIEAGLPASRFKVILYGIDVKRFENLRKIQASGYVRFSYIGHLGRHKGVHTILEALSLLGERTQVRINLVGDGPQRTFYEQRVHELGWGKSVRFWGKVDNGCIERVYRETDVLVLPSIWPENHPVSITEAMASRIPVIASRMGGIPELVEDGKTGYLLEAGNARELAQKMLEFIVDRSKVSVFGENAFRRIADNTFVNQIEKIIEVYNEGAQPNETHSPAGEVVIVCVGKCVDLECAEVLNVWESDRKWWVMMADWVAEDQLPKAKLLWVVDKGASMRDVAVGLRNRLPLLVPEDNAELRDLCRHGQCGLYYKDAFEAMGCIEYLTQHEALRKAMGQNGYKLFSSTGIVRS